MSTPRKRLGNIVSDHLKSADAALATANILQQRARNTRQEATGLQEKIVAVQERLAGTDIKRYPDAVTLLIRTMIGLTAEYRRVMAQADAHEADALRFYETVRRLWIEAQTTHKED